MAFVKACDLSQLEEDEIFRAQPEGGPVIAVYKLGDAVFATADVCSHGEASLSEDGFIDGEMVVCSWHDGGFDIRTGEARRAPCFEPIRSYAIELRGDEVFVDI